jgi:hypothetical protein
MLMPVKTAISALITDNSKKEYFIGRKLQQQQLQQHQAKPISMYLL